MNINRRKFFRICSTAMAAGAAALALPKFLQEEKLQGGLILPTQNITEWPKPPISLFSYQKELLTGLWNIKENRNYDSFKEMVQCSNWGISYLDSGDFKVIHKEYKYYG